MNIAAVLRTLAALAGGVVLQVLVQAASLRLSIIPFPESLWPILTGLNPHSVTGLWWQISFSLPVFILTAGATWLTLRALGITGRNALAFALGFCMCWLAFSFHALTPGGSIEQVSWGRAKEFAYALFGTRPAQFAVSVSPFMGVGVALLVLLRRSKRYDRDITAPHA